MKDQADKKRSFQVFKVGDKVFLKLQPYKSKSQAGLQVLQALSHH